MAGSYSFTCNYEPESFMQTFARGGAGYTKLTGAMNCFENRHVSAYFVFLLNLRMVPFSEQVELSNYC